MSYLSPKFTIGDIRIGTIEGASCFNIGNNLPTGFESYKKQSQGFGSISGDHNEIKDIVSKLKDGGLIDMLNQSGEDEIPDWIKKIIIKKMKEYEQEER